MKTKKNFTTTLLIANFWMICILMFSVMHVNGNTITITCTGSLASYKSGSVSPTGVKNDGNMINLFSVSAGNKGWATFDLSSLSGATITAVTAEFTTYSSINSAVPNIICGVTGDPSILTGTNLFNAFQASIAFNGDSWSINGLQSKVLNSAGIAYVQASVGGNLNLGFVRGSSNVYNIYGYNGIAPPKLIITYTPCIPTSASTSATACDSYTWACDGQTYIASGTYTCTSLNAAGCVHTEILNLTITPSTSNTSTASACDLYMWSVNSATYTQSGTYTNFSGCHTETLNLTIQPLTLDVTTYPHNNCGNGTFIACNGGTTVLANGGALPYSITTNPASNIGVNVSTSGVCPDTYTITVTDNNGCTANTIVTVGTILACADTNSLRINTGWNPLTGNKIPSSLANFDPKWSVKKPTSTTFTPVSVASLAPTIWLPQSNSSNWLFGGDSDTGNYIFRREFKTCISDSLQFNFQMSYDNELRSIRLDDNDIYSTIAGDPLNTCTFSCFVNYTITIPVNSGFHKLDFVVNNSGGPTGLHMIGTINSMYNSISMNTSPDSCCCPIIPCDAGFILDPVYCMNSTIIVPSNIMNTAGTGYRNEWDVLTSTSACNGGISIDPPYSIDDILTLNLNSAEFIPGNIYMIVHRVYYGNEVLCMESHCFSIPAVLTATITNPTCNDDGIIDYNITGLSFVMCSPCPDPDPSLPNPCLVYSYNPGGLSYGPISNFPPGTYTLTATDIHGCTSTKLATVLTSIDITPPVINCFPDFTISLGAGQGCSSTPPLPSATDNCAWTPNVTADPPILEGSGVFTVVYTSTDVAGNVARCTTKITLQTTDSCCTLPPKEMVAWWPFDEPVNSLFVKDIVGGHNSPYLSSYIEMGNPGKVGGSMQNYHNNSPALTSVVGIESAADLNFGYGDFSIDAWIYRDALDNSVVLGKAYTNGYWLRLDVNAATGFYMTLDRTDFTPNVSGFTNMGGIPVNMWTHIAAVVSHSSNGEYTLVKYFKNGILKTMSQLKVRPFLTNSNYLVTNTSCTQFKGKIDELEIFNRALDAVEVKNIFDAGSKGKCKPACITGSDIWMKDTPNDKGDEYPAYNPAFNSKWIGTDIWVRNNDDGHIYDQNQTPIDLTTNYIFVRVRNRGCNATPGGEKLKIYWSLLSSLPNWPSGWNNNLVNIPGCGYKLFADVINPAGLVLPSIRPGETEVFKIQWIPPPSTNYSCLGSQKRNFSLLARLEGLSTSPGDDITFTEVPNVVTNVRKNNNIILKNQRLIRSSIDFTNILIHQPYAANYKINFTSPDNTGINKYFLYGNIKVNLGTDLFNTWVANGMQGAGFLVDSNSNIILTTMNAWIGGLGASANQLYSVRLNFDIQSSIPDSVDHVFNFDMSINNGDTLVGGDRIIVDMNCPLAKIAGSLSLCSGSSTTLRGIDINETSPTYQWQFNAANIAGANADSINVSTPGVYSVSMTNAMGCVSIASDTVVAYTIPVGVTASVTSNYNGTQISCAGASDGVISAFATGGSGIYQYSIDNGNTYQPNIFDQLSAGNYTIIANDGNPQCSASTVVTLSEPVLVVNNVFVSSCDTYTWNGITYSVSGVYTNTYISSIGCDSIQTLNLTINSNTTSVTSSGSYVWPTNGTTYTASGTYTTTTLNATSCGNVFTLNLVITPPCISGNYTINKYLPTGGINFNSFTDAITAISSGICGPVVFNVMPATGPYNEQIALPASIGATAINTVTFNGNGNTLSFSSSDFNNRHVIKFDGADYITFNNLVIDGSGGIYGWGVHLRNNADHNTVNACTIKVSKNNTYSNAHDCIVLVGSANFNYQGGQPGSYNTFSNNELIGGFNSAIFYGHSNTVQDESNKLINNSIKDFYAACIDMNYQKSIVVSGNDISRPTRLNSGSTIGIFIGSGCLNSLVDKNRIHNIFDAVISTSSAQFIGLYGSGDGTINEPNLFINNSIYNIVTSSYAIGVFCNASDYMKVYHNTISLESSSSTSGPTSGVEVNGIAVGFEFKNNIITLGNEGASPKIGLAYTNLVSTMSNNNDVHVGSQGTGIKKYGSFNNSTFYTNLNDWQTANGGMYDGNSKEVDPMYVNPSVGNYTPVNPLLDNAGVNVNVAYDINGNPRSSTTPDVGAFEFNVTTPVLGTYPSTSLISGTNTTITPSIAPINTLKAVAYTNTNFSGIIVVNPTTGVVTVTDAKQAGTYIVTVKAFGIGTLTITTTFALTVTHPICSDGLFINKPDISVGGSSRHIAVGDFNNDGIQDLATANYAYNNFSIRLGDGSGGFSGSNDISSTPYCGYMAIGDFNGDGKQDIATPHYFANKFTVFLGDGQGGFNYFSDASVGTNPLRMAIGDFNADGKQDIACSNIGSNNISIRLGDGLGGFSGTTNVALASIINPGELAIADFNNDGKQDIACTINGNGTVSILIGDGTGNFSVNANINTGASPNAIAIGDFNGDGNQDFVTSNYNNGSEPVSVRLGNGSGGFSNGAAVLVAGFPRSIAVGDFNGDGKLDLATASVPYDVISIRYGDGSGNFSGSLNLPVGDAPYSIAVGDFDGDGKQDISSISPNDNTVSIRLGKGAEINVKGNNTNVIDGDMTPGTSDHTDFGIVSNNLVRTFTIQNTGNSNLTISNINMSGANAGLFTVGGITFPSTIAANGSTTFTITFAPTTAGLKTATVNISSNDCDEAQYDFAVQGSWQVANTLHVKCYFEGLYIGSGMMTPALMNQGVGNNVSIADSITVELRNTFAPYSIASTINTILYTDGTATCSFPISGTYYIAIKHRNGIQTWSANPVTFGTTPVNYNFSDDITKAFGNNQASMGAGIWAFYSGDINQDENIDLLDISQLEIGINEFQYGYFATDINGDGNVDLLDSPVVETNINNFIFSNHP